MSRRQNLFCMSDWSARFCMLCTCYGKMGHICKLVTFNLPELDWNLFQLPSTLRKSGGEMIKCTISKTNIKADALDLRTLMLGQLDSHHVIAEERKRSLDFCLLSQQTSMHSACKVPVRFKVFILSLALACQSNLHAAQLIDVHDLRHLQVIHIMRMTRHAARRFFHSTSTARRAGNVGSHWCMRAQCSHQLIIMSHRVLKKAMRVIDWCSAFAV